MKTPTICIVAAVSIFFAGCGKQSSSSGIKQPFFGAYGPPTMRFEVSEITPVGVPHDGQQAILLSLKRQYGKMDRKSLDFYLEHETQNLTLFTRMDTGYDLRTNDIVIFDVSAHLKLH